MKISLFRTKNYIQTTGLFSKLPRDNSKQQQGDIFLQKVLEANNDNCDFNITFAPVSFSFFEKSKELDEFSCKPGMVTIEEYNDVKKNNSGLLQEAIEHMRKKVNSELFELNSSPKNIVTLSKTLMDYYDELYGKDNYSIISIGTSPAVICQTLKYLGKDVYFFPASQAKVEPKQYGSNPFSALEYLKEQGIDFNTDKKIILLDYKNPNSNKKHSLDYVQEFLCKSIIDSGISGKNIFVKHSIVDDLHNARNKGLYNKDRQSSYEVFTRMIKSYAADCYQEWIVKLSNVPHNSFAESNHDIEYFKKFSNSNARIFGLCILDELNKMGYIN